MIQTRDATLICPVDRAEDVKKLVAELRENDLEAARERYTQEAERWRACYRQTKVLQQLVDKYYLKDLQDAERREQKELDEQVLRRKKD